MQVEISKEQILYLKSLLELDNITCEASVRRTEASYGYTKDEDILASATLWKRRLDINKQLYSLFSKSYLT